MPNSVRTGVLEKIAAGGHEQVIAFHDAPSGLRGFLAIHSTRLGPAFGGVRFKRYAREDDALDDALRLSRAMTYKCALAGCPAGGGKAVILDRPGLRRARAFEAFGRVVDALGGRFFTGGDVGIRRGDLAAVGRATRYVADESSAALGDVNEHTAIGVWHGLRACFEACGIAPRGARVVVQGVGNVGGLLAAILARADCDVLVADTDPARARRVARATGARVIAPGAVARTACEALAPCALGGTLDARTIAGLRTRIVCGAANNQLRTPEDGDRLARRGILYAPDYLVNAGGVLRGIEYYLLNRASSTRSLSRIGTRMAEVARRARRTGVPTARVADAMAAACLRAAPRRPRRRRVRTA